MSYLGLGLLLLLVTQVMHLWHRSTTTYVGRSKRQVQ